MQRFMRNSALWFGVGKTGKGRETENLMNISSRLAMIALVSGAVWTTQPASAQTTIIQQQPSTAPSGAATVRITPEQRTVIKKRIGTKHPSTTVKQRATVGTTAPELYRSEENQRRFQALRARAQLTRYGGDAYFFCMMAAGHLDIAMDCGLQPYDITPLLPIVTGAGGAAAEWTGGDLTKGGNVLTAGSAALLDEALAIMSS